MHAPARFYPAFDRAPFCLAVCGAQALPGPVLVELMTRLEGTAAANRTILHRMVSSGSLEVSRAGRVGVYRAAGRLQEDLERIRDGEAAAQEAGSWDGRLHSLIDDVPGRRRVARERFRARAIRLGYRPLREGVLVAVRDHSGPLREQIVSLQVIPTWWEPEREAAQRIVRRAWGLDQLQERGERIVLALREATHEAHDPGDGEQCFARLHALMRPAVAWSVAMGDLPEPLLPAGWPGEELRDGLAAVYRWLFPRASAFARSVAASSRHAALVQLHDAP